MSLHPSVVLGCWQPGTAPIPGLLPCSEGLGGTRVKGLGSQQCLHRAGAVLGGGLAFLARAFPAPVDTWEKGASWRWG